jgi:hypothetical protein
LLKIVLEGDWTLVTRNAYDFRGPEAAPGTRGQYQRADIHAGLICLDGPEGMDLDMQRDLFDAALDEIDREASDTKLLKGAFEGQNTSIETSEVDKAFGGLIEAEGPEARNRSRSSTVILSRVL